MASPLRHLLLAGPLLLAACTVQPKRAAETAAPPATNRRTARSEPAIAPSASPDTLTVLQALIQPRYPKAKVLDFKAGDLNADRRPDLLVVAEQPCDSAAAVPGARCRTALLVLNEGFPALRIAAANAQVVDCSACAGSGQGDPYLGATIQGAYFALENYYGGCARTDRVVTFRYDNARQDWFVYEVEQ